MSNYPYNAGNMTMIIPISKFDDLHGKIANLESENARLKAEVTKLTFDPLCYLDDEGEWMPRHIHLAAVERLKAHVERLTKAGQQFADDMVSEYGRRRCEAEDVYLNWNAAKEGKDQP